MHIYRQRRQGHRLLPSTELAMFMVIPVLPICLDILYILDVSWLAIITASFSWLKHKTLLVLVVFNQKPHIFWWLSWSLNSGDQRSQDKLCFLPPAPFLLSFLLKKASSLLAKKTTDYTKDLRYQKAIKLLFIFVRSHGLESPDSSFFNTSDEQK